MTPLTYYRLNYDSTSTRLAITTSLSLLGACGKYCVE